MRSFAAIFALVVVVAVGVFVYLWASSAPAITLAPGSGPVSGSRQLVASIEAPRSGLSNLQVIALQGGKTLPVLAKNFPSGARAVRETFTLASAGLQDGPFTLQVKATGSIFSYQGRTTAQSLSFSYDNTPPVVAVLSTAHNIIRGGAGLVVYTVSKEVERTGVLFGDRFVPGYPQGGNFYACLFPFPYNAEPDRYTPRVIAVDKAGNERVTSLNYHLLVKPFSTDRINLSDSFLEKIAAEFKTKFPQVQDPLELFLQVNGAVREQNLKSISDHARQTAPTPLWQDIFRRMPNSAPLGGFAQTRSYFYKGNKVDEQTHLGFDLASVVQAPVPSANNGKVVFAGDMGIYGQCVIVDHGLGLQTLYAHLSRMQVKSGDSVTRGQIIGNTGATGMAAGDHLHYGVLVAGQEVNPVEWWDASWIKNNITGKLELISRR